MSKSTALSGENSIPLHERLQAVLDGEFAGVRQQVRDFVSRPDFAPVQPGLPKAEYREKVLGWLQEIASSGISHLPYDPAYGGEGKLRAYMHAVDIIFQQDMSLGVKQGVQFGLFGLGMYMLGTEKHHARYLSDIMEGKLLGGFAMTEASGGSDVQGVGTEAVYDHATRGFTLQTPDAGARKAYIGNAAQDGEMMVVFAQLKMEQGGESQGVHAFMVPIRDKSGAVLPGVTAEDCGHKIGLNGVDNGYLSFNQVKLPYDALLDRFASIDKDGKYQSETKNKSARFFKMIGTLVTGRICIAAASDGSMKTALASVIPFAANRKVFGDMLLDKPATQARIFPHLASAYALHFATRHLADRQEEGAADLETMAAAIKAKASDSAVRAIDEARILAGGRGYMSEERYGTLRNDVDIFRTFEGDNTVLRLLAAKNRLGVLKKKFNKASGPAKIAKMASLAFDHKMSKHRVGRGKTSSTRLLDSSAQNKIFLEREHAMLYDLSVKLQKIGKAEGFESAINKCQTDMIAYSDAYAERVMMAQFTQAVEAQKDPEVKAALKDMCDLFAVHTMRENALWYIEKGYMTPAKTKALASQEEALYAKIRPNAESFTAAFAVPEALLSAQESIADPKKPGGNKYTPAP